MSRSRTYLFIASFALSFAASLSFFAKAENAGGGFVRDLPSEIADVANKGRGEIGDLLSDAIFDQFTDLELLNAPLDDRGGSIGINVGRAVYSNNDVQETFTVVDRMRIPVALPGLSVPIGASIATFDIGLSGQLDFSNIRIVKPSNSLYRQKFLDEVFQKQDLKDRKQELESSDWLESVQEEFEKGDSERSVFLLDSLRSARYGRLWNLISHPLRLPLRAEWLSHFEDAEIITYGGSGTIEVGPSVGISYEFNDPNIKVTNLGANLRAYLRGDFRISVMKVSASRVKLKVARKQTRGTHGTVGGSSGLELYEGFLVSTEAFGRNFSTTIGRLQDTLVPLRFSAQHSLGSAFEVGYEYDLNDERAVEAYEQAVTGRLALSDELSAALVSDGEKAAIRKVFSRRQTENPQGHSVGVRLFLSGRQRDGTYKIEEAMIEFPDGTSEVFKAKTDLKVERRFDFPLYRNTESVNFSVRTDFIQRINEPDSGAVYGWIAEGRISDSNTSGREMNRYAWMIESLFGVPQLMPTVPTHLPAELDSSDPDLTSPARETRYGRSDLYFRAALTSEQLIHLAKIPADKMWTYIEEAFDRPAGTWQSAGSRLFFRLSGWFFNAVDWLISFGDVEKRFGAKFWHADAFQSRWMEVQDFIISQTADGRRLTIEEERKFARLVGEMFSDSVFTYELIKTALVALRSQGENAISYQINAQSAAFPAVAIKGGMISEIEKISQKYEKETDFEKTRIRHDLTLEASRLAFDVIDIDRFELRFEASRNPQMVLIKVDELSDYLRLQTTVRRFLVPNRGRFQQGENRISLERFGEPGFQKELAQAIRANKNYRITVALIDGENAGPAASIDFFVNPYRR